MNEWMNGWMAGWLVGSLVGYFVGKRGCKCDKNSNWSEKTKVNIPQRTTMTTIDCAKKNCLILYVILYDIYAKISSFLTDTSVMCVCVSDGQHITLHATTNHRLYLSHWNANKQTFVYVHTTKNTRTLNLKWPQTCDKH